MKKLQVCPAREFSVQRLVWIQHDVFFSSSISPSPPPPPSPRPPSPSPLSPLPLPAPPSPPSPSPKMHLVKYSSQWKFGRNHSVSNLAPSYLIGDYVFALSSSLSIYSSHQIVGFLSHEKIIVWSTSEHPLTRIEPRYDVESSQIRTKNIYRCRPSLWKIWRQSRFPKILTSWPTLWLGHQALG